MLNLASPRFLRRSSLTLAIIAALSLGGCEMIEEQTGLNRSTQKGAFTGAAVGGIIAALAQANPGWIAASVVMGGVAGGAIGNSLGKKDATTHVSRNLHALDTLAEGQAESWSNSKTGNGGSTTVRRVSRKSDGTVCKTYTESVRTKEQTVTKDGTACKAPGKSWVVQTS